jgi:lactoylglutathione lyase
MHVDHAALRVADLDATRSFYEGVLGLEPGRTFDLDGRRYHGVRGDGGGALQFVVDPAGGERETGPGGGLDHVAVVVDDVDAAVERVRAHAGVTVESEPETPAGRRLAFVRDPDDYRVEFLAPANGTE